MRKKNPKFMPVKLRKKIRNSPKYWGSLIDWMHFRGFKKKALYLWAKQNEEGNFHANFLWF